MAFGVRNEGATGRVLAVSRRAEHLVAKANQASIRLLTGLGVEGDSHAGVTVQHRSRVASDPSQPNLRQVHLLHVELLQELEAQGFTLEHGRVGENVTTQGIDLLGLPTGTLLRLGSSARVRVTGLRNPCSQLDEIQPGLMAATLDADAEGHLIRKAGIMGIVVSDGDVRPGDGIEIELPPEPHRKLEPV